MTRIFLDTEFTVLTQQAQLISLALVSETGDSFYAEFNDYDKTTLSNWHIENVIAHLSFHQRNDFVQDEGNAFNMKGSTAAIKNALDSFLFRFKSIEIWGDNHAYDWVLFCQLWGGALHIPKNIHYLVRDLATLFQLKGQDPDINRLQFAYGNAHKNYRQHHALADAQAENICFEKLMKIK